jgi:hypothetical protein
LSFIDWGILVQDENKKRGIKVTKELKKVLIN